MSNDYKIKEIKRMLKSPIMKSVNKSRLVNSRSIDNLEKLYSELVSEYKYVVDKHLSTII